MKKTHYGAADSGYVAKNTWWYGICEVHGKTEFVNQIGCAQCANDRLSGAAPKNDNSVGEA